MLTGRLIGEVEFLEPEGDLEGELALFVQLRLSLNCFVLTRQLIELLELLINKLEEHLLGVGYRAAFKQSQHGGH